MKKFIIVLIMTIPVFAVHAQTAESLSIEDCYILARQNYPLVRQKELILKSKEFSIENASKGFLPQLNVYGQGTYQSEVTEIPIKMAGVDIPVLNKDQYRLYAEITQTLYDGGLIKQQKEALQVNSVIEDQKLEVELYKLKERINQLFFGVLLVDEQLKQNDLHKKDLLSGISKTEAAILNGTALKTNADALKAELLKAEQRATELRSTRKAYLDMLGLFLNAVIDENIILIKPQSKDPSKDVQRPELRLYDYQKLSLDVQSRMIAARTLPKFNIFFQGGYGRPALNMLSNDIKAFYITGVRFNWSLIGFYTNRKEKELLDITRRNIDIQKETFLFNTNLTLKQQSAEISKFQHLLSLDTGIIALRANIKNTALSQLQNGIINTNDYLREVNAEDQAKINMILHEIQMLMARFSQQATNGN